MATRAEIIERMTAEVSGIQAFMVSEPTDEPTVLAERLAYCNVYLARSGEMLAQAKAMLNEAVTGVWERKGDMLLKAGAQIAQKVLAGYCKDEQFLVDWLDRVNKGLVHQSDNLRTLVSYAKANMTLGRYADEVQNDIYERTDAKAW
jgi:hypothetical protein